MQGHFHEPLAHIQHLAGHYMQDRSGDGERGNCGGRLPIADRVGVSKNVRL